MNPSIGKQSIQFEKAPVLSGAASVVGPKESDGPLSDFFDEREADASFGQDSWEKGESEMIRRTLNRAIQKANRKTQELKYIFGGDLNGQLIGTTFGIKDMNLPVFGLYGACSTCGESLSLSAMTVAAGYARHVAAVTSSHYGSAEKQFRFPLEYGNQRPLSATWTVTGCGAFVVSSADAVSGKNPCITGITTGKIVDYGIRDSFNMGASMAPAAADAIYQNFVDFNILPEYYDQIITGDLGKIGSQILIDLLQRQGYDISKRHSDCGVLIFDNEAQDTHSGGSGCGCSAATLAGYILKQMERGVWKRVLFVPTGALLSTVSFNEGQTIPGIAHCVMLEQP
jgi:stage V sporulation protein AD